MQVTVADRAPVPGRTPVTVEVTDLASALVEFLAPEEVSDSDTFTLQEALLSGRPAEDLQERLGITVTQEPRWYVGQEVYYYDSNQPRVVGTVMKVGRTNVHVKVPTHPGLAVMEKATGDGTGRWGSSMKIHTLPEGDFLKEREDLLTALRDLGVTVRRQVPIQRLRSVAEVMGIDVQSITKTDGGNR